MFAEKNNKNSVVWATYRLVLYHTGIRIGDLLPDGDGGTVARKNRSVGTLEKKQTDRDVVRRVCTRLAQIR